MIRKATEKDIQKVEKLYEDLLSIEENVEYSNWQKGIYPNRKTAEDAFEEGNLFVGVLQNECEEILYGAVILNTFQPQEYGKIAWQFEPEKEKILVIHTLCIHPDFVGQGKGREFVAFSEEYAKQQNMDVIRLDTYEGNIPATNLYVNCGYLISGKARFHFKDIIWETLICFEKKISEF